MSSSSTQRIEEEAGRWLVRRDSNEWTQQDESAFDQWMNASMTHSVAFWRLENVWEKTPRLKALHPGTPSKEPPPPGHWPLSPHYAAQHRQPARMFEGWRAIAAAIAMVAVIATTWLLWPSPDVFSTPIGGLATVPMADGSKVTLNTDSAIQVKLSGNDRTVELTRGEAYFEIAKDPLRPFSVNAGDTRIVAVGTQFSVHDAPQGLEVLVTEGRVRIESGGRPVTGTSFGPGSVIHKRDGKWTVEEKTPQEIEAALSWRSGILTFRNTPLAEAANEFNRYNRRQIVIADDAIAALPIGGNFRANNIESFVDILERAYPVRAEAYRDRIEVLADR